MLLSFGYLKLYTASCLLQRPCFDHEFMKKFARYMIDSLPWSTCTLMTVKQTELSYFRKGGGGRGGGFTQIWGVVTRL